MKNIAILGAAGFIGTNLASVLAADQENTLTLIDQAAEYFRPVSEMGLSNVRLRVAMLDEHADYEELLGGADVLYHLVSTTVPTTSNQNISRELIDNVVVSAKILDACVRRGVGKVVFFSSGGTVYGKEADCPLREDMPTNPISSYGVQKLTIEKLLYLYRHMYGLDYRIVRLSNPYGPYQRPNGIQGVVTTFIYKALRREEIPVFGNGSVVRDFIYISDALEAVVKIAGGEGAHRLFNVGCGYGTSVSQVLDTIRDTLGVPLKVSYQAERAVDVPVNFLNITRYEQEYGKLNPMPLDQGVRRTADFLRRFYHL